MRAMVLVMMLVGGCGDKPDHVAFQFEERPPFIAYGVVEPNIIRGDVPIGESPRFFVSRSADLYVFARDVKNGFTLDTLSSRGGDISLARFESFDYMNNRCDDWSGTFSVSSGEEWSLVIDARCKGNGAIRVVGEWRAVASP